MDFKLRKLASHTHSLYSNYKEYSVGRYIAAIYVCTTFHGTLCLRNMATQVIHIRYGPPYCTICNQYGREVNTPYTYVCDPRHQKYNAVSLSKAVNMLV